MLFSLPICVIMVAAKKPSSERKGDHEVVEGACVTLGLE